jgi:hypothetical protein
MNNLLHKLKLETNIYWTATYCRCLSRCHFSSIFNQSSSVHVPNNSECTSSDFLNIPYISDSDVKRAFSCIRSTKWVGPDEIPNFIIKCFSFVTFSISVNWLENFPRYGRRLLLYVFLRKATEFLLAIIDLSRFLIISPTFLKVLYTITFHFILNLSYIQISMIFLSQILWWLIL